MHEPLRWFIKMIFKNMKMMYATCGLQLFIINGLYCMYIKEEHELLQKHCDLIPTNTSLPCREFIIPDQGYCNESKLRNLFPDLYKVEDPKSVNLPGQIQDIEYTENTIEWAVTRDGSVNYLKGFQVIQIGNDYSSFHLRRCSVIDLSEMTKSDLRVLMETKFVIRNGDAPGSYYVIIKPLPLLPYHVKPDDGSILQANTSFNVYHPQMNVMVNYTQLNTTAVNISVTIDREIKDLTTMEVMILTKDWHILQNVSSRFNISQKSFVVKGLTDRNYSLKLTPLDPYMDTDDQHLCVCYYGTSESRSCTPCQGYVESIHMEERRDTISKPRFDFHDAAPQPLMLG